MAAFDFNTTNPKEHKIQCEEALEKKTKHMLKLNFQFLLQTILIHYKKLKKSILKKSMQHS